MNKSIIKTVLGGVVLGAVAFFAPHIAIGLFLFFGLMRLFFFRQHAIAYCEMHQHHGHKMHFADHIRSMSDVEYTEFKSKMGKVHRPCRNCETKTAKCEKCENK
ncbi:MAG: hypothetical protein PHV20_08705 [Bacteroidales bacterium]|nr:hypothetical protein [Bacteroidales bacterium]